MPSVPRFWFLLRSCFRTGEHCFPIIMITLWSIFFRKVGLLIIQHTLLLFHHCIIIHLLRTLIPDTELSWNAIAGPFDHPPFADDFVSSPLQTVPKRGTSTRRVVMDLSFPHGSSVNDGISQDTYLGEHFKLRLPGIDRVVEFILEKGRNCLIFKKDLRRAYRQFPVDPKDYNLLGFCYKGKFYFDTRCPFGLRSSAMICQRMTKASISSLSRGFSQTFILTIFTARNIHLLQPRPFPVSVSYSNISA